MEQSDIPITPDKESTTILRPILALEREDVGNLDAVLRGYYLSQIKKLEKRKDRKLARTLLEDHLILPKSRQRTSKDSGYIKEILGIEYLLLDKLEESRLIRRIHKTGTNPIYEVSHDTLVEPILSEKRDREAIARFIKRTWKYVALLLLLWFLLGILFQESFEPLPIVEEEPKRYDFRFNKERIGLRTNGNSFELPLNYIIADQEIEVDDTMFFRLPVDLIALSKLNSITSEGADSDTISIQFASPIPVPIVDSDAPVTMLPFNNVVVPLAVTGGNTEGSEQIFASLTGSLKMTRDIIIQEAPVGYNEVLPALELELGDTMLQAEKSEVMVPMAFTMRLTDLFDDENDKNNIKSLMGDRQVRLKYRVGVRPTAFSPQPPKIEYPAVQGIEVQYADGTKKFISGDAISDSGGSGDSGEKTHTVASGETLFSIAKKYGLVDQFGNTSISALKRLNGLTGNTLKVGQTLKIPE